MFRPDGELTAGRDAPIRNNLLYTVNMLVPVIDLGYRKWIAHGTVLKVTAVLVILGWVLAAAVAAAFTDIIRRGD